MKAPSERAPRGKYAGGVLERSSLSMEFIGLLPISIDKDECLNNSCSGIFLFSEDKAGCQNQSCWKCSGTRKKYSVKLTKDREDIYNYGSMRKKICINIV